MLASSAVERQDAFQWTVALSWFVEHTDLVLLWRTGTCIDLGRNLDSCLVRQGRIA